MIKYHNDDNFNVQSLIHFNLKSATLKKKKKPLFNQTKKFQIDLKDYNYKSLNEKFKYLIQKKVFLLIENRL